MSDLISRQAAIDAVEKYFGDLPIVVHYDMLQLIKKLPSAERWGRWEHPYGNKRVKVCSECGHHFTNNLPWQAFYCPICGARMEEDE